MKRLWFSIIGIVVSLMFACGVHAAQIDKSEIVNEQKIGNLLSVTISTGNMYVSDGDYNIIGGPYKLISDLSGYCYVHDDFEGNKILFDTDGTILAKAPLNYDINHPSNGIYAIHEISADENAELIIYDYETRQELLRTNGIFLYYLEQQADKMFIKSNGKYAIIDNKCNFITDYIYDDVKKRFNPDYEPFPHSYAIVVQDGIEKYIDWDLNEINLDDYNGEVFITNCRRISGYNFEKYKNFYVLESGNKHALYDMDTDKIIIPYQTEYNFNQMNDKYIIINKGEEEAIIDYDGNMLVPYSQANFSLREDGLVSYSYYDGDVYHEGTLTPEDGEKTEAPLDKMGCFYKVLGGSDKENIAFGTIVSGGKAADIRQEDLRKFIDVCWNFYYERVIAPMGAYNNIGDTYIKLWNKDKSKSYIIYDNLNVMSGKFGEPTQSHGEIKANYLWYSPIIGNSRNALYTAFETIKHTYFDKSYEGYFESQRDIEETDKIEIPSDNLLPLDGASEWAKTEIQKAAACNLLIYELTDKYQENITRLDFCKLAQKLIVTEYYPYTDTRMIFFDVVKKIIDEKCLRENNVTFSDCDDTAIDFMARAGIVDGMGDGTFAPNDYITREQAATILYRIAEFLGNKTIPYISESLYYYDLGDISEWALNPVRSMYLMNIMNGDSNRYFYPKANYTVEQAIATMLRLYECY